MKKLKYILFIAIIGLLVWGLSGGISSSQEKATPSALWSAFKKDNPEVAKDEDEDGLSDEEEKKIGTDPKNPDTDGDKFLDGEEYKHGFDALKPAPFDRNLNQNTNQNLNQNLNSNSNQNQNQTQTPPLIANQNNNLQSTAGAELSQLGNSENYTDRVALKADELIARYRLYTTPYDSVNDETRASLDEEINNFITEMLEKTGLNFSFNIPEEKLTIKDDGLKEKDKYLLEVKTILKKSNLITESQNIEEGFRNIASDLTNMSKSDIDWERINILKRGITASKNDMLAIPISPELKNLHVRTLRLLESLNIVLVNIDEIDYFRAFIAAGRAEKINEEIDKFSSELKDPSN